MKSPHIGISPPHTCIYYNFDVAPGVALARIQSETFVANVILSSPGSACTIAKSDQ